MRNIVITRVLTAVWVVSALALAGCATSGTDGASASSSVASSTVTATSSAPAAASSVSAGSNTGPSVQTSAVPSTPGQSVTESGATDSAAPQASVAEPTIGSTALPADGSGGWYDTWGWVSPQTAQRALAVGIVAGKDVRDELRCGSACGESPTAAEIQAQYLLDHPDNPNASIEAYEAAAAACPGYFIRGNCYADAEAAAAAGEGE